LTLEERDRISQKHGAIRKTVRIVDSMADPIEMFRDVFEQAVEACVEPEAMVLSTVDPDGRPSSRWVLLKAFDQRGFVFYTNLDSRKARALAVNPYASLCFYWAPIERQVRIEGSVERVSDEQADAYFASRPREFQLAAWASRQSAVLDARASLDERVAEVRRRLEGHPVCRPPFWSGFRVIPSAMEFWRRDPARLHHRERYTRDGVAWTRSFLYP
jgi:pyridoxamine 5'-phosphate oxidase